MEKKYFVSSSPHISDQDSVSKIMYSVIIALVPAGIGGVYFFGLYALWIILISMVSAIVTEAVIQKSMKKPITVSDGSAALTGILLAYCLSIQVPLWMPVIGSVFAIAIGKQVFGGLGHNPMNPALIGRAFLLASWPTHVTVFDKAIPKAGYLAGLPLHIDGISQATPLNLYKQLREIYTHPSLYPQFDQGEIHQHIVNLTDSYAAMKSLFVGNVGGCIGETSALLLLMGAAYLMYKRHIGWKIPFSFVGTVALLGWIFAGKDGLFSGNMIFQVLSGGLILGAFFMATDVVTSPLTFNGRIVFGMGCGAITVLIRVIGGYPEGVCYAILLMNLLVPILDRLTKPNVFGGIVTK
jgi:Na+-translocating ferredoxin:NAD+ oxidoreductase subunit D